MKKEDKITVIEENKPTPEQAEETIKRLGEYLSNNWIEKDKNADNDNTPKQR